MYKKIIFKSNSLKKPHLKIIFISGFPNKPLVTMPPTLIFTSGFNTELFLKMLPTQTISSVINH